MQKFFVRQLLDLKTKWQLLKSSTVHVNGYNHVFYFINCHLVFKFNDYVKRKIVESSLISPIPGCNSSAGQFSFNKINYNKVQDIPSDF